jgi:hypothetical protein
MKTITFLFTGLFFLAACNNRSSGPDVSGIRVEMPVARFDQDIFSADTTAIEKTISSFRAKYPELFPLFSNNILGLNSTNEETGWRMFLRQNRFLFDSANSVYGNFNDLKREFENAFRYVKYYFPGYKIPELVTIVGPPDAFARNASGELTTTFLTERYMGIFLQFYIGKNFSLYQDPYYITNIAPQYRSRRFDKTFLVADAMKLIADDIYPDRSMDKGLIEQMIEKGKQWWLLDKFLPSETDSVKTGYTTQQLEWCRANEGMVWNEIITSEKDLYTRDPVTIQNYLGEAPFTQTLSPFSPGNIGQWVGWQIVKKFAEKNSSLTIGEMLETKAGKILELAKYKPK